MKNTNSLKNDLKNNKIINLDHSEIALVQSSMRKNFLDDIYNSINKDIYIYLYICFI